MGAADMNSTGFNADASRYNRENRTQQAEFAPGQGDPFAGGMDIFSQSTTTNNSGAIGDIFSQDLGSAGGASGGIPMSQGSTLATQQNQVPKDASEQFWDAMGKGFKASSGFVKDLSGSFSKLTVLWWYKTSFKGMAAGVALTVVGFVLRVFGMNSGFNIAIGSLLGAAVHAVIFFWTNESSQSCTSLYKDDQIDSQQIVSPVDTMGSMGGMDDFSNFNSPQSESFGDMSGGDFEDTDDDDSMYGGDDEDDDSWGAYEDDTVSEPVAAMSAEDALASLPDVPKGMYERRYLYDMFLKVLPSMKPDFATLKDIDDDSDLFLNWCDKLIEASQCAGCKEDNTPELTKLQENLFTVIVTCTRPQGCKPDLIGQELANIYAYDEDTGERNENVFAKVDVVGTSIKITLFNGANQMISVKDMIQKESEFFLNTKNIFPVVFGVNQTGKVLCADFRKLESILVTGMPRSGKTWLVQSVLAQLCAFTKPTDLHFYICDPKGDISDFKRFCLPHVKKFVTADNAIIDTLRYLVKQEAPRRTKIIGEHNYVNIWDFKERHPDVELPIIYVVIDEVVTLASRMEKDVKIEFRALLRELISRLPALGIRAFLIPHIINDDIIEKKTTDLIDCRISVKGSVDHIEKVTGAKPRDFQYRLVNTGDMAVRLMGFPNVMFNHGAVLTDSNVKNEDLFDYLRRVWSKLEPESVDSGGVSEQYQEQKDLSELQAADFNEEFDLF